MNSLLSALMRIPLQKASTANLSSSLNIVFANSPSSVFRFSINIYPRVSSTFLSGTVWRTTDLPPLNYQPLNSCVMSDNLSDAYSPSKSAVV